MASSHHHHHHHLHHTHQFNSNNCNCNCATSSSSCCCTSGSIPAQPCCTSSSTTSCASVPQLPPPPPPLLSNPADQLLQALATTLLLQCQHQLQPQPPLQPYSHPHSQFQTLPIPPYPYTSEHLASSNHHQCQYAAFQHKAHPSPSPPPPPPTLHKSHEPLASLLDRVAALESSLFSNPSAAKSAPASAQKPSCCSNHDSSKRPRSLGDLAARTIQIHFRQYLVRRSQILRDLKRLAVMKCHVAALRSAVSCRGEIDPRRASDQAADLLLQLDFIRSADPMIYEGKRAIEKELVRIIEFVDKVFPREQEISLRGTDGRKEDDGDKEGVSTEEEEEEEKKPKKKVSFEERSNRSNARNSKHELYKDVFDRHCGESFQFPKEVFEIGDELEFDQMEGPFGRKVGERGSGSSAPVSAQNDPRRSDERR